MAETITIIIGVLLVVVWLAYTAVITSLTAGWLRLLKKNLPDDTKSLKPPAISIIIAARNEEKNIVSCLQSLNNQTYKHQFEVVVVDDHSTDSTNEKILAFIRNSSTTGLHIRLIRNPGHMPGKKAALQKAISMAEGEWIVTTDADCIAPSGWLETISKSICIGNRQMFSAPVLLEPVSGMFQKFQQLEFISLIASGAGAIEIGKPIMCNGANLIFKKSSFSELLQSTQKQDGDQWVSGDDIFLMMNIKKQYGSKSIGFIANHAATVYTPPQPTVAGFLMQRIRWASKTRGYSDWFTLLVAGLVFSTSFLLMAGTVLSLFFHSLLPYLAGAWGLKLLVDFPLLYFASHFFGKTKLLWHYPLFQVVYILYISIVAPVAQIVNISWKGRRWKK
ncbi:MAG TPA: glycosyltransferase [Bacteroidales bacterium]|nr:glycosyltransferase [Bacteroidales bacterium]